MKAKHLSRIMATTIIAQSFFGAGGALPVQAAGEVPIDEAHFPDPGFRAVISRDYDTDGNGALSDSERGVYNLVLEHEGSVKSLEGIEYFPEVRGVWCRDCNITGKVDFSKNPEITGIWCSENPITEIDITQNAKLEWIYCFKCNLTSLDVTNNSLLAYLECNDNVNMHSIDLSHNADLEHLIINSCKLNSLDVSHNPKLSHLDALRTGITSLDLSNNKEMKRLDVWDNPGLDVDISGLYGLEFYNCANNGLTHLDVTHNPELMCLFCDWNRLTELDLSHNPRLAILHCADNGITHLDVSNNPQLYYFQVFGNPVGTIDINNNSRLSYIMEQVDNGSVQTVYDSTSSTYDTLIDWGGSHQYMDDMRYFISVRDGVSFDYSHPNNAAVRDSYINTDDALSGNEDLITRGEAIQTLYDLAGRPGVSGASRFTDVAGTFYEDAVIWAEKNDICQGYPEIHSSTFAGDKPIARQDLAIMVHRYAEYKGWKSAYDYGRTDHMEDFFEVDFYAWGAFTYAIQWEVLPVKNNHIYPHGRVTADEYRTGLENFLEHCGARGNINVSTAGGNGHLESSDLGGNRTSTRNSGAGSSVTPGTVSNTNNNSNTANTVNVITNTDPVQTANDAVNNNSETLQREAFAEDTGLATVTETAAVSDNHREKLAETVADFLNDNSSVSEIRRVFMADVTTGADASGLVRVDVGRDFAGERAYSFFFNGNEWVQGNKITISDEGEAEDHFENLTQIAFVIVEERAEQSSSSSGSSQAPAHHHEFAWVVTVQPTLNRLGEELYRCEGCGKVLDERTIDYMATLYKEIRREIHNAPQNGAVKIETGGFISLNKAMAEEMQKRSDVTVTFTFQYKEQKYEMTVPAGFDWMATLNPEGWTGFLYIGSFEGVVVTPIN